jgi:hypothetical protein
MKGILALVMLPAALLWADTAVSRIDAALESGAITIDEAALYYVWSVRDAERLPSSLVEGTEAEPCGTPAYDRVFLLLDSVSEEVGNQLQPFLARPGLSGPENIYDTPGGHFKLHWTATGADATNLAWVQLLGTGFDTSWQTIINTMDWDAPPSDLGLGGDTKYDVYFMSLEAGTMGYCTTSGEPPDPTTPEADYASYIVMSTNESYGAENMTETTSHEFLHGVEAGYEAAEPSWFKENCSTWVQNEVWTTNHYADYLHTGDNCLRKPWYDIRTGAMYHYGASPWPMYMEVRCGGQATVRSVWEYCADVVGTNMLDAIDQAAGDYGMTFEQWLAEYTCWRWFTGALADNEHYAYEESSLWTPGAYVFPYHNVNTLPWSGDEGTYPPEAFGNHWIKTSVSSYQGWITFDFNGRDGMLWQIGVIQTAASGEDAYTYQTVTNPTATATFGVCTTGWQYVIFAVQPITNSTLDFTYTASITAQTGVEGDPGPASPTPTLCCANPFAPGGSVQISLPTGGFTTISVYDLSGRLVDTPLAATMDAGDHTVSWDAEGLSQGAYFVRLTAPGGGMTLRVVLQ